MFNPTELRLKPSNLLSFFLSVPFTCAIFLIAQADIPLPFTFVWTALACFGWYFFISKYARLSRHNSICLLEAHGKELILREHSGKRLRATLADESIIHPNLSILTFYCEPVHQQGHLATVQHHCTIVSQLNKLLPAFLLTYIYPQTAQTRRHVIICRYNASCLMAYRRLRVNLTFS